MLGCEGVVLTVVWSPNSRQEMPWISRIHGVRDLEVDGAWLQIESKLIWLEFFFLAFRFVHLIIEREREREREIQSAHSHIHFVC